MLLYASEESPIGKLNSDQNSLVVSLLFIGGVVGTTLSGVLADIFGRKRMLISIGLPQLIANVLILVATDHFYIYVARFIFGVAGGGCFILISMFVTEISHERCVSISNSTQQR